MPKFSTKETIDLIERGRLNYLIGVPALYEALLKNPRFCGEKLKNVLVEAAREAVAYAETFKGLSGAEKKSVALKQISEKLRESKSRYDEAAASEAIEKVISLSKEVNGK